MKGIGDTAHQYNVEKLLDGLRAEQAQTNALLKLLVALVGEGSTKVMPRWPGK